MNWCPTFCEKHSRQLLARETSLRTRKTEWYKRDSDFATTPPDSRRSPNIKKRIIEVAQYGLFALFNALYPTLYEKHSRETFCAGNSVERITITRNTERYRHDYAMTRPTMQTLQSIERRDCTILDISKLDTKEQRSSLLKEWFSYMCIEIRFDIL